MNKVIIYLVLSLFLAAPLYSANQNEEAFIEFLDGDGSSTDRPKFIKNISDYDLCDSRSDCVKEFEKNFRQEEDFLNNKYGDNWKFIKRVAIGENVYDEGAENDHYYDKVTITLIPSQEEKIIYFDITDPYQDFQEALWHLR